MKSRLLALLYPHKCIFCGALLEAEEGVCSRCGPKLPVTDDGSCAQEGDWFRQCVSPFFLEGPVREAIHRYKFQHQEFNGVVLGRWMGRCARTHFSGTFDLITWVPVSRKRRWERGFDQSGILAKEVARAYGGAAVQTLKKLRHIPPLSQTEGGAAARQALVQGIYGLSSSRELSRRRVLLVDDVITTGSTLNEASRVLLQAGAAEVCCVTAARSRPQNKRIR